MDLLPKFASIWELLYKGSTRIDLDPCFKTFRPKTMWTFISQMRFKIYCKPDREEPENPDMINIMDRHFTKLPI
jgi:hypothetical protein